MRKTVLFALITGLAGLMLSSCGGNSYNSVASAEEEFEAGRLSSAQSLCDSLILGPAFYNLSVDELCRLSMLTSRLADTKDEDTNLALAARCMQAALQREPDSVLIFVHSLSADEQSRTLFIRQLARTMDPSCEPEALHDIE